MRREKAWGRSIACGAHILALSLTLAGGMASAALPQSPPVTPQDFVNVAAGADLYEIRAAQTALTQSHDPGVRAFAQAMLSDHGAMVASLKGAASRSGLMPPSDSVGGDQTMLLSSLQSLREADFDKAYAHQQVLAHRSALATEGAYARMGSDLNLRNVAAADVPMIQRHLERAEALQSAVGQ